MENDVDTLHATVYRSIKTRESLHYYAESIFTEVQKASSEVEQTKKALSDMVSAAVPV